MELEQELIHSIPLLDLFIAMFTQIFKNTFRKIFKTNKQTNKDYTLEYTGGIPEISSRKKPRKLAPKINGECHTLSCPIITYLSPSSVVTQPFTAY